MKKKVMVLIFGLLLIGVNLYAAGDLLVEGKMGIGVDDPGHVFHVDTGGIGHSVKFENTATGGGLVTRFESNGANLFQQKQFSNNYNHMPIFAATRGRGTSTTPLPADSGDILFRIQFGGWGYSDGQQGAEIRAEATQDFTDLNFGTKLVFRTANNTASTLQDRMIIDESGFVGIGATNPKSRLAVSGLPIAPPDSSGTQGIVCITNNGNMWIDDDGTYDCQ